MRLIISKITRMMQNNSREIENAYLEGLLMDEYMFERGRFIMIPKNLKKAILLMDVVACLIFSITGCSNDKKDTAAENTAETEAETDEASSDQTADAAIVEGFVGKWLDTHSGRCQMSIACDDGVHFRIEIEWAQSAAENYRWELTGTYSEEEEGILYTGAEIYEIYNDDGSSEESRVYEDGEGIIYIVRNGKLYWEDHNENAGDDCVFEKVDEQQETAADSAYFSEDWFHTYDYFESEDGDTLEIAEWEEASFFFATRGDGTGVFDGYTDEYKMDTDGAYVYEAEVGGGQLRYYPAQGNCVEIEFGKETTRYYPAERPEINSEPENYYVTDSIYGDDLNVHVWFAYTQKEYGNLYLKALCNITNRSGGELTLATDSYFSLNNNGIIKSGYCDYDYSTMASGATISTWVSFCYPESANTNLSNMTLTIDGIDVFLADKPQSEEEKNQLAGVYYSDDGSVKLVIERLFDGSYQMIYHSGGDVYIDTFTLNEDNTFVCRYDTWTWLPETYSILRPSILEEIDNITYSKR